LLSVLFYFNPNPQKVDFAKDFWLIWPMAFFENPPMPVGFSQAQK
jgi:hypothetical protein